VTWSNWYPEEPNDHDSQEDCGIISSPLGEWYDNNCGHRRFFICEKSM
jgi:hypothetical protein